MNDQTKIRLRYVGIAIVVIIVLAVGWAMFSRVSDNGRTIDDLKGQLDSARTEQRNAEEQLRAVQSGLSDSQRTVDGIDESNRNAEATADRISDINSTIKSSVDAAAATNGSSADVLADSEQRLGQCQQILDSVSQTAKSDGE